MDEIKRAISTNYADHRATTTPTYNIGVPNQLTVEASLEVAAAREDVPIELFSSTFNARFKSCMDISRM